MATSSRLMRIRTSGNLALGKRSVFRYGGGDAAVISYAFSTMAGEAYEGDSNLLLKARSTLKPW